MTTLLPTNVHYMVLNYNTSTSVAICFFFLFFSFLSINFQASAPETVWLRCRSAAARLLRSRVRILLRAWMFIFVSIVCYVGGDELIVHPGESYKLRWCVCVCVCLCVQL